MSKTHFNTHLSNRLPVQQVTNHSLPLNMVSELLGSGFVFSCLITLPMITFRGRRSTDAGMLNAHFSMSFASDSPTVNATTVLILQLPLS